MKSYVGDHYLCSYSYGQVRGRLGDILLRFLWLTHSMEVVTRKDRITDELISTGMASTLLGTSRQQVVNLCDSGHIPCFRVGKHRRIQRADVLRYRERRPLTRDQVRSLWLHQAIARRVVVDPDGTIRRARSNLQRLEATHPRGLAAQRLEEWEELLDGPIDELLEVMTSRSERGIELRQNSPFAGVLSEHERGRVLDNFRRTHAAAA